MPRGIADYGPKQWFDSPPSLIEHEILTVTDYRPKPRMSRTDYLHSLIAAADDSPDEVWDMLSLDTQIWINEAIESLNEGYEVEDPAKFSPSPVRAKKTREAYEERQKYNEGVGEYARKRQKTGKLSYQIRDILCDNMDMRIGELREELQKRGYSTDNKSLPVIHSYTASALKHARARGLIKEQETEDDN